VVLMAPVSLAPRRTRNGRRQGLASDGHEKRLLTPAKRECTRINAWVGTFLPLRQLIELREGVTRAPA
jgi:hypothetical protein